MLRIALLVKDWGISINEKEEVFGLPRLVLPPVLNVSFRLYSPFSLFFFTFAHRFLALLSRCAH